MSHPGKVSLTVDATVVNDGLTPQLESQVRTKGDSAGVEFAGCDSIVNPFGEDPLSTEDSQVLCVLPTSATQGP